MAEAPPRSSCLLYLPLGKCKLSFDLEKVVCNHGFFMMAPNKWIPSTKTLQRPLRLGDLSTSVIVSISHPPCDPSLHVLVHGTQTLSTADQQAILEQVARMLRITDKDEKALQEFQQLHPEAKKMGFGRIFRSPSLFEDTVKSILLCNCTWVRTLKMAKSLCELQLQQSCGAATLEPAVNQGKGKKRKLAQNKAISDEINENGANCRDFEEGNFPSSKELASFKEKDLKQRCGLGYRASLIIRFAKKIEKGTQLDLRKLEKECDLWSHEQAVTQLEKINGFGSFAIACILMCMGCYQKVPVDTETKRHLQQVHGRTSSNRKTINKDVEEIYNKYAPFQCLAYWFELLQFYEKRYGKLSELSESDYSKITGSRGDNCN